MGYLYSSGFQGHEPGFKVMSTFQVTLETIRISILYAIQLTVHVFAVLVDKIGDMRKAMYGLVLPALNTSIL